MLSFDQLIDNHWAKYNNVNGIELAVSAADTALTAAAADGFGPSGIIGPFEGGRVELEFESGPR